MPSSAIDAITIWKVKPRFRYSISFFSLSKPNVTTHKVGRCAHNVNPCKDTLAVDVEDIAFGSGRAQTALGQDNIEFSCRPESDDHSTVRRTAFHLNALHPGGQLQRFVMAMAIQISATVRRSIPAGLCSLILSGSECTFLPICSDLRCLGHLEGRRHFS